MEKKTKKENITGGAIYVYLKNLSNFESIILFQTSAEEKSIFPHCLKKLSHYPQYDL
jgi:hypothetical protein